MTKFDHKVPYNDLPLLPPRVDIETKQILRKTISAGRALAQLNGTLLNLLNPTLFLDTIYLQEAKASSEEENNQSMAIFLLMLGATIYFLIIKDLKSNHQYTELFSKSYRSTKKNIRFAYKTIGF